MNQSDLSLMEFCCYGSQVDLPLPPRNVSLLLLRLVARVNGDGVRGLPSARLQELVDKGVNVIQEGRGPRGLRLGLGRGLRWGLGAR